MLDREKVHAGVACTVSAESRVGRREADWGECFQARRFWQQRTAAPPWRPRGNRGRVLHSVLVAALWCLAASILGISFTVHYDIWHDYDGVFVAQC